MSKKSKHDFFEKPPLDSNIQASQIAKIFQRSLQEIPDRIKNISNNTELAKPLRFTGKSLISKDDIKRKLHERLDFDDEYAYIGVLLCSEEMPDIPVKHFIAFSERGIPPHVIPQEPYPSSSAVRALYRDRKVDSSYLRWRHSDIAEFLEGHTQVNAEKLFIDIVTAYKRYCYFESEDTYYLLALWIMGTYLFPLFPAYPLILLNGPLGSGKSRTHAVSACMAFNARSLTDPNNAIMFRLVDNQRSSLFFDDAEWLARSTPTRFLSTLKSSYKKTAKVPRVGSNKDGSIDEYEIYSPKMFNNIDGIENVIGSRTITFTQKIAPKSAEIDKHDPDETDPHWAEIRNRLYMFTLNYWQDVKKLLPEQTKLPLTGRMYEIYCGILSIAQFLDPVSKQKGLHKLVLAAAMRDVEERKCEYLKTDPKALVIQALLKLTDGWYTASQIVSAIKKATGSPREFTPIETGRILKSLGFGKGAEFKRPREGSGRPSLYYIKRAAVIQLAKRHNIIEE